MSALRLAIQPWSLRRGDGVAGWARRLDAVAAEAAGRGATMLLCPEYASLECAAGEAPDIAAELRRAVAQAPALLEAARRVAAERGIYLVPGTMPFAAGDRVVNRAPLIGPDGRAAFQDKHVMTRFEAEQWGVQAGAPPAVFDTAHGRIGIAICFDAEFPHLVRAQVEAGAWLILAPSCTDTLHGFNRVRIACAARAMENQCYVAMAPTVGDAPWCAAMDANRGAAAAFGPVDRGFPQDGVLAQGELDSDAMLLVDLDPARLDAARRDGAVRNHLSWPPAPPSCRVAEFA